ncbi:hypothetical protein BamMEX5DRAFT_5087 [Burkholderia ambifaria MEX-5]|uniref:Uncharacterized protein n=1 Tax=Burkholderia ambifaria MEX-5 TaxID=396597 RepID=B1TBC1_9BURK|nr:hypothetical protein BamMEX5DRAFT_5087 [Burkholderia ambifaria MEX-5]
MKKFSTVSPFANKNSSAFSTDFALVIIFPYHVIGDLPKPG